MKKIMAFATKEVNKEIREVYRDFSYEIEYADFATIYNEIRDIENRIGDMFERTDDHSYCRISSGECTCGMDSCIVEFEYNTTEGLVVVHGCYQP